MAELGAIRTLSVCCGTSLIDRGKSVGISVRRHVTDWLCECHVVSEHSVRTVVLGVVANGSGWEKRIVDNVVPVLLSLQHAATIRVYSTEADTRVGYALAAAIGVADPLVVGCVTQTWQFETVRKHFLAEFVGLSTGKLLEKCEEKPLFLCEFLCLWYCVLLCFILCIGWHSCLKR